jgi:starvation-inducible DNA-binding protein
MSSTTSASFFKREILENGGTEKTAELLQTNLVNLVDLALLLKQAHWAVVGPNFRSIHLHLDEIIEAVRESMDEVAERMSTLGVVPDGRSSTVAEGSKLDQYPADFLDVGKTIHHCADAMKQTIDTMRAAIEKFGDLDPITEDLCIGISGQLEKHLWMLQAQEVGR